MNFESSNQENIEAKRQEFFTQVDAGEFDHIIKARDTHWSDQFNEAYRRYENPKTPEELIEAVEFDHEIESVEPSDKDKKDFEKHIPKLMKFLEKIKGKEGIELLREEFKENPKNFEAYLEGRL